MILRNQHGHRAKGDQGQADNDGRCHRSRSKTGGGQVSREDNLILSNEKVSSFDSLSPSTPNSISEIIKVFN